MKKTNVKKPLWEMNANELAEATKEFDVEIPEAKLRPLSPAERRRWERVKRGPSRSIYVIERSAKGAEAVVLELERKLLRRVDAYAESHHMTRSQVIENSLQSTLLFAEAKPKRQG